MAAFRHKLRQIPPGGGISSACLFPPRCFSSSSSSPSSDGVGGSSGNSSNIEKILVANRREITCRIMRTTRCLGIHTVAVFSDADCHSLHSRSADEAACIGPPPARSSYLNASAIIHATKLTGTQTKQGMSEWLMVM